MTLVAATFVDFCCCCVVLLFLEVLLPYEPPCPFVGQLVGCVRVVVVDPHWKGNFPLTRFVRLSVAWLLLMVGRSVII